MRAPWPRKTIPELRAAEETLRAAGEDVHTAQNAFYPTFVVDAVYGIEANEFALHSAIAAEPQLGILPNLGYFITLNLNVPVWDWGGPEEQAASNGNAPATGASHAEPDSTAAREPSLFVV